MTRCLRCRLPIRSDWDYCHRCGLPLQRTKPIGLLVALTVLRGSSGLAAILLIRFLFHVVVRR